eukprot:9280877-Pyramimonas_sp.AAC.3
MRFTTACAVLESSLPPPPATVVAAASRSSSASKSAPGGSRSSSAGRPSTVRTTCGGGAQRGANRPINGVDGNRGIRLALRGRRGGWKALCMRAVLQSECGEAT